MRHVAPVGRVQCQLADPATRKQGRGDLKMRRYQRHCRPLPASISLPCPASAACAIDGESGALGSAASGVRKADNIHPVIAGRETPRGVHRGGVEAATVGEDNDTGVAHAALLDHRRSQRHGARDIRPFLRDQAMLQIADHRSELPSVDGEGLDQMGPRRQAIKATGRAPACAEIANAAALAADSRSGRMSSSVIDLEISAKTTTPSFET